MKLCSEGDDMRIHAWMGVQADGNRTPRSSQGCSDGQSLLRFITLLVGWICLRSSLLARQPNSQKY